MVTASCTTQPDKRQRISAYTSRACTALSKRTQPNRQPNRRPTARGSSGTSDTCVWLKRKGGEGVEGGERKSFYLKGKQAPPAAGLMPGRLEATWPHITSLPCLERGCTISVGIIREDKEHGARIMREEHGEGRAQNNVNFPRLPEG